MSWVLKWLKHEADNSPVVHGGLIVCVCLLFTRVTSSLLPANGYVRHVISTHTYIHNVSVKS